MRGILIKVKEIKEKAKWLEHTYHSHRVIEQTIDDEYYRDEFAVPNVKAPYTVIYQGTGRELVDVPALHIVTAHPQVYVEATDSTDLAIERAKKKGSLLNHWVEYLGRQNPNPFKEGIKKLLKRGEQWIHVVNNSDFQDSLVFQDDIPIVFAIPDPLIVFGSPDERNGIPDYVVMSYKRYWRTVLSRYEQWTNPKNRGGIKGNREAEYFAYIDSKVRYFEADGEPLLPHTDDFDFGGVQPNVLEFCPFVHAYSGYGDKTASGAPEDLAVSRLRGIRDKLLEETEVSSYIASQLKLHSVGRIDLITTAPEFDGLAKEMKYALAAGSLNIIPGYGMKVDEHMGAEPGPAVFAHLAQVKSDIQRVNPPIMQGIGTGSSGRQEDIYTKHALAQYESVINNSATAWSIALGLGLRILKNKDFKLLPVSTRAVLLKSGQKVREITKVTDDDIDDFSCTLKLKAADPIEDKAQTQIGANLQGQGIIDWETNLTKYQGYSLDEAKEIQNKAMAEKLIFGNPQIMEAMALEAMKELGIELPQVPATPGAPQGPVPNQPGRDGGPPRQGNRKSIDALAKDADMQVAPRGPRASPGLGR